MRTDPFFASVCQSPSGVAAGSSSSREIFKAGAGATGVTGAATSGVSIGGGSIGCVGAGITTIVPVAGGVIGAGGIGGVFGGSIGAGGGATFLVVVVASARGVGGDAEATGWCADL